MLTGFQNKQYIDAFREDYIELPSCRGWIKKNGTNFFPFFCPRIFNASTLLTELDYLDIKLDIDIDPLVLSQRTINFFNYDDSVVFKATKTCYINDLETPLKIDHAHWDHTRNFARNNGQVSNVILYNTVNRTDWGKIFYEHYIAKHSRIDFTENTFIGWINTPGVVLFSAEIDNKIVGLMSFYRVNDNVYYHLSIVNDFQHGISCAMAYAAISYFKQLGFKHLIWGSDNEFLKSPNELAEWKKGFSTTELPVYNLKTV